MTFNQIEFLFQKEAFEPQPWQQPYSYLFPQRVTGLSVGESERAKALVREFGRLGPNWDGYGALPLSRTATANATRFLEVLSAANAPAPDLSPLANGTIALEWRSTLGCAYLEIGNSRFSMVASQAFGAKILCDGDTEELGFGHAGLIEAALFPEQTVTPISQISI